jgi:hydroxypyruvate reductase
MLVRPAPGLTLEEKVAATTRLLACGASITEINVVRKHLSVVKGGGVVRHADGRSVWTLILSDVIGDDIGTIGSGPTAPDPSSFGDALDVVLRYGLEPELPPPVVEHLREGLAGRRPETPKGGERCFGNVRNEIIGSNGMALDAAAACVSALGFTPLLWDVPVNGDTTEAGTRFAAELVRTCREARRPTCVLAGGETTVRLRGTGKGGRNQEFALAAALALDGVEGVDLLSAGTDGVDGPTDAAGAFANGRTIGEARARGLDPEGALIRNDSYSFFEALGHLFRPGPTGTNVMDLKIALLSPRPDLPVREG